MGLARMTIEPESSGWYNRQQVLRIVGVSRRQLAAWERQGWVQPLRKAPNIPSLFGNTPSKVPYAHHQPRQPAEDFFYTFTDIVAMKALLKLRKNCIPVDHIRRALASLRAKMEAVDNPLAELPIRAQGRRLGVYFQGSYMDPVTGQLHLDFSFEGRKGNIYLLQRERRATKLSEAATRASAEKFFRIGLHYEQHPKTWPEAIRAYRKAVVLNPKAVGALNNLGTLYYNQGNLDQAVTYYEAALAVDPDYGLLRFNLGNVFDERNEWDKARDCYEQAVRLDPSFADAHYNLALVYEKLGFHGRARQQWRLYVKLDPDSSWSPYARQQLLKTPLRIVARGKSAE
ncbi:MAG: tetratricopeptide repeat protein [Acidobacteria bacterium]|nr:tetratricopeptide repeat protein [Acidobacteriota bacterium]